ncbi:tyrosine-type recombinase/integrase [Actinomadura sp. WMMA1423]|uniref:tyrosine-type recombinase/integrase n=1 Tax=Actinomadura sp. WMMA1423 TaxID=2591108 RepID=UPI0034A3CEC3
MSGCQRAHPHMLRHTFVTTMLDAGLDQRDVQIAARHADPHHVLRPSPQQPRPPPQLHPRRLNGLWPEPRSADWNALVCR